MKRLLIKNIGMLVVDNHSQPYLCGKEMSNIDVIKNAWLLIEDGRFKDWGEGERSEFTVHSSQFTVKSTQLKDAQPTVNCELCTVNSEPLTVNCELLTVNCNGAAVLPSFCDPHTHLVYADSREGEFVDKIRGLSYAEIARRGGGILNSADRLHELSEDELYRRSMIRIDEIIRKGTGAVEIKSGYGLNTEDELKMLRVIRRIKETAPIKVVSTFLGAHAVGRAYQGRQSDYVDLIINEMLPAVAREGLADFIDVFCDEGFFTPEETDRILKAGLRYGLRGKIHGQELADSGGVEVAVRNHALSVDHLESMTDADIRMLTENGERRTERCMLTENGERRTERCMLTENGERRTERYDYSQDGRTNHTSQFSPLTSHPSSLTSHLSPLTSHLSPLTSHLSPLTSHLSPLTSQFSPIPTALPGTSFFLNMPFAPGRKIIDAGLPLAIASDYNPGSTPSGDMKFAVSLACIKMRLLPAEALNAATINAAAAMGLSHDYGSIARGKVANFIITEPMKSIDYLPYAYTSPIIRHVFLNGEEYNG